MSGGSSAGGPRGGAYLLASSGVTLPIERATRTAAPHGALRQPRSQVAPPQSIRATTATSPA